MEIIKRRRNAALQRNNNNEKECCYCRLWLPEYEYYKCNTLTLDGLQNACKICQTVYKYGLTRIDILKMLKQQKNRCAVCKAVIYLKRKQYHLDHNHDCCPNKKACPKCIRGLLCYHCNVGLGSFHDSPLLLEQAASYLRSHK